MSIHREGWLENSFYSNLNQPPEGYRTRKKFKGLDLPRPQPAGAILQSPQALKSLNGQPMILAGPVPMPLIATQGKTREEWTEEQKQKGKTMVSLGDMTATDE
ncbi:hypothetical protein HYALB_00000243 [Hymenoscyphus albidus]|uniref:Uncharacterized protein n=1 Tax=Hymenoscyphus albidus TaxID=595503 RepID=A0A9N9Q481_9HELO|nr:hypothetical protein HYALB_00000243 [Hymenoscyphus albidus]